MILPKKTATAERLENDETTNGSFKDINA